MTKKPVSLKEKEPTISDIGKPIYFFNDELIITDIVSAGIWTKGKQRVVDKMYFEWCYWQPVTLVSEEYLKQLEANQIDGRCKDCVGLDDHKECPRVGMIFEMGYCSEFSPKAESGREDI